MDGSVADILSKYHHMLTYPEFNHQFSGQIDSVFGLGVHIDEVLKYKLMPYGSHRLISLTKIVSSAMTNVGNYNHSKTDITLMYAITSYADRANLGVILLSVPPIYRKLVTFVVYSYPKGQTDIHVKLTQAIVSLVSGRF